jgi:hypothetical protein
MKITEKRLSSVVEGMLVKFGADNVLEPFDGSGSVAGVANNCRVVVIQPDPDQPGTDVAVCELVVDGACQVLVDSACSSQGAHFGPSTTAGQAALGATPMIGFIQPQSWSNTTERAAGLMPALVCMVRS